MGKETEEKKNIIIISLQERRYFLSGALIIIWLNSKEAYYLIFQKDFLTFCMHLLQGK